MWCIDDKGGEGKKENPSRRKIRKDGNKLANDEFKWKKEKKMGVEKLDKRNEWGWVGGK